MNDSHENGAAAGRTSNSGLRTGHEQYIVACLQAHGPELGGYGSLAFRGTPPPSDVETLLRATGLPYEVVRRIKPRRSASGMGPFAPPVGAGGPGEVLVVRMDAHSGNQLRQEAAARNLLVETDSMLGFGGSIEAFEAFAAIATAVTPRQLTTKRVKFRVLGDKDKPLPRVAVTLHSHGFPSQGITDQNGDVEVELINSSMTRPVCSLWIQPEKDYWAKVIRNPDVEADGPNVICLEPYDAGGVSARPVLGWGQELMGLHRTDPLCRGQGVKIAIIDTGCDVGHPLLSHIVTGRDVRSGASAENWRLDEVGHGTHCAGIIAAKSTSLRGFAPDAEIHVLKIFPGGRFSDLIEALDQCIERGVDVINLSLGSNDVSALVEHKLMEVKQHGIACIAAAGNSGGDVQYPASSSHTLGVAAVGRIGEFPPDSTHATTLTRMVTETWLFSARFTCGGHGVDLCAPGVAIVSTVPGNGLRAMDGTSMAASHVTGLAALILGHHPVFQTSLGSQRSAQRVELLYSFLRAAAQPLTLTPDRAGVGLPTVDILRPDLVRSTTAAVLGSAASTLLPMAGLGLQNPYFLPEPWLTGNGLLQQQNWYGRTSTEHPLFGSFSGSTRPASS